MDTSVSLHIAGVCASVFLQRGSQSREGSTIAGTWGGEHHVWSSHLSDWADQSILVGIRQGHGRDWIPVACVTLTILQQSTWADRAPPPGTEHKAAAPQTFVEESTSTLLAQAGRLLLESETMGFTSQICVGMCHQLEWNNSRMTVKKWVGCYPSFGSLNLGDAPDAGVWLGARHTMTTTSNYARCGVTLPP